MITDTYLRTYFLPDVSLREVRRYMRSDNNDEVNNLINACYSEMQSILTPIVCFCVCDIEVTASSVIADRFSFESSDLAKCLRNCDKMIMFAATIGLQTDRLISKYSKISPSKAVCFHALGSERIEVLCDEFCEDEKIKQSFTNCTFTPRFSPGYGNLSIENQKVFDKLLNLNKNLGISFGEGLLMTPSKSVTAIIGIKNKG